MKSKCPQYNGEHQWAVCRVEPPLSQCQNCNIFVNEIKGDQQESRSDPWNCRKCKKIQRHGMYAWLTLGLCNKCWKELKRNDDTYTNENLSDQHPHYPEKFEKNCRGCREEEFKKNTYTLYCPNCFYPALSRVTGQYLELGIEIRCDNCLTCWKRTKTGEENES